MENYINKYKDQAEYNAAASGRPVDASSASAVGAASAFDGINVIVPIAARRASDHVFLDKLTGKLVAVRGGTLRPSLMDSDRYANLRHVFLGRMLGMNVFVQYDQMAAAMFASPDEWTVSGFDFTASGSVTILFKYYSAGASDGQKSVTLTWEAGATIEALITTINGTTGVKSYCKAYKIDATTMGITVSGYSSSIGLSVTDGDVTATRTYQGYQYRQYTDDPRAVYGVTEIVRHDGTVTTSAFANYDKFFDYYKTNGVSTTETLDGGIVKESAFNMTTNPDLYTQFGGDYAAYMTAKFDLIRAEYPCNRKAMAQLSFGDGSTAALAAVTHTNFLGETVHDFPNAYAAALAGVSVAGFETGFEPGKGHLGGIAEALLLYRQINRSKTDPINVAIKEAGGTVVDYATTTRLAFQSNATCAWLFYGFGYLYYYGYRVYAGAARVFRAFTDSDLEL